MAENPTNLSTLKTLPTPITLKKQAASDSSNSRKAATKRGDASVRKKQKSRKNENDSELDDGEEQDEEEESDDHVSKGGSRSKQPGFSLKSVRSTTKTYEEPGDLSVIKPTQSAFLSVTEGDIQESGCFLVKECITQQGLPFVMTFIGRRGGASIVTNTRRIHLHCSAEASEAMMTNGAISTRGTRVAGVTESYVAYLWDISNPNDPRVLYAVHTSSRSGSMPRGEVALALSASGTFLMVHERDAPIFVWASNQVRVSDVTYSTTAQIIATLQGPPTRGFGQIITSATFSNDHEESLLFAGFISQGPGDIKHYDCCVYDIGQGVQDLSSRSMLMYPVVTLRGHDARITSISHCPLSNSAYTATSEERAFGWGLHNNRCKMFCSHPTRTLVQHVVALPNGAYVATASSDGFIRIWGCYPHYSRNSRGYVPLLSRLNPPAEVCRRGAHILQLTYEHAYLGLTAIWYLRQGAAAVPEPASDRLEDNYSFVPLDAQIAASPPSNTDVKRLKVREVLGAATSPALVAASGTSSEGSNGSEPVLRAVRYSFIPCVVVRYRSDIALIVTQWARRHVNVVVAQHRKYIAMIVRFVI